MLNTLLSKVALYNKLFILLYYTLQKCKVACSLQLKPHEKTVDSCICFCCYSRTNSLNYIYMYFCILKMDKRQYSNQYLRLSCIRLHIVKPFGIPLPYKRIEGRAIVIFSLDLVYQQKIVVYNRVFM